MDSVLSSAATRPGVPNVPPRLRGVVAPAAALAPTRAQLDLQHTQQRRKMDLSDLVGNQVPRSFTLLAAESGRLTGHLLTAFNVGNLLLSLPAVAYDIRDLRRSLRNPDATPAEKRINTMMLCTDLLAAGASVPLLVGSIANPVVLGTALALTAIGIVGSIIKVGYDFHHEGDAKKVLELEGTAPLKQAALLSLPVAEVAAQALSVLALVPVIGPIGRALFVGSQVTGLVAGGVSLVRKAWHHVAGQHPPPASPGKATQTPETPG